MIIDQKGRERERYALTYGSRLHVREGAGGRAGHARWSSGIRSPRRSSRRSRGKVEFHDIVEGENVREETDKVTGLSQRIIVEASAEREARAGAIVVGSGQKADERRYLLPSGSHLMVHDGQQVFAGDVLVKIPRETTKTKDITGGLPRVVELFEARTPEGAGDHHRDRRRGPPGRDPQGHAQGVSSRASRARRASTWFRARSTSTCRTASGCAPAIR